MLVPTGRGKELEEQELPPEEYERALEWMYDAQQESELFMKPTDVPHYWRVMRQRAKAQGRALAVHPHSHGGMNTLSRGCLAGVGFCFISHVGGVQPCGYFDKQAGDVRHTPFGRSGESRRCSWNCATSMVSRGSAELASSRRSVAAAGRGPTRRPATTWRRSRTAPTCPRRPAC